MRARVGFDARGIMMASIPRGDRRASVQEEAGRLTISMPMPRFWRPYIGLAVGLVMICWIVLPEIFTKTITGMGPLLVGLLVLWALSSAFVLAQIYLSRELIIVDDHVLRHRVVLGPIPRRFPRQFELSAMSDLRAVPNNVNSLIIRPLGRRAELGAIAFQYGGPRVVRIGQCLDEDEAAELVERIKAYSSRLARG